MSKPAEDIKSILRFSNYVVNEIHFVRNEEYKKTDSIPIEFDIEKDIKIFNDTNSANVTLDVKVFDQANEKNYPFYFRVKMTGFFQVENVETEEEKTLVETNAIAILFPYIRALISSFTANANVSPLILPPINVVRYLQNEKIK
jgi:protein-export chaperone SecB